MTVEQAKKEERDRILDKLEEEGHGSGNWRRLIIQMRS